MNIEFLADERYAINQPKHGYALIALKASIEELGEVFFDKYTTQVHKQGTTALQRAEQRLTDTPRAVYHQEIHQEYVGVWTFAERTTPKYLSVAGIRRFGTDVQHAFIREQKSADLDTQRKSLYERVVAELTQ